MPKRSVARPVGHDAGSAANSGIAAETTGNASNVSASGAPRTSESPTVPAGSTNNIKPPQIQRRLISPISDQEEFVSASPGTSNGSGPRKDVQGSVLGLLERVQVDAYALANKINTITATQDSTSSADARATALRAVLDTDLRTIIGERKRQLEDRHRVINGYADRITDAEFSTHLEEISNLWDEISFSSAWRELPRTDSYIAESGEPTDLAPLRTLAQGLTALGAQIGKYAIPKRLKALMAERIGVGAAFDFHKEVVRDLPVAEDRAEVLQRLAVLDPDRIGGVVDAENGVIYRIGRRSRRWMTYLLILAPAIVAAAGFWLADANVPRPGRADFGGLWGPDAIGSGEIYVNFTLLLGGVLVHIAKKTWESRRLDISEVLLGGRPLEIRSLALWIHVKYGLYALTVGVAVLLFGFLTFGAERNPLVYFLAGYTIDSVAASVLKRYAGAVSVQSEAVKKELTKKLSPA